MYSQHYKRNALIVLTTVYTLSFMDRIMMGMLMQPIKEELQFSDTQLGFLTGIAFALFYATLGIPIARWADRGNRVTIIAISMALWGGMVTLCGLVTNFLQMVLVRIGAAVGEAGCMPPAYSLIGDYFPVAERVRALSIYMAGISISIVVSFLLAGWINEHYGWRLAFLILGLPGLMMAVLVKCVLREPRKNLTAGIGEHAASPSAEPPILEVIAMLWQQHTYRYLVIAITLANFVGIGVGQWFATFFIRHYAMATGELGIWLGLVGGLGGVLGAYMGGHIADRYLKDNPSAQLRYTAVAVGLILPCLMVMLLLPHKYLALFMLAPINFLILGFYGPVLAMMQQLVEDKKRAMSIAVTMLILNLIGMGLGPQVVGILSDAMSGMLGVASLQVAMLISSFVVIGASYYFWQASNTIEKDLFEARNNKTGADYVFTK